MMVWERTRFFTKKKKKNCLLRVVFSAQRKRDQFEFPVCVNCHYIPLRYYVSIGINDVLYKESNSLQNSVLNGLLSIHCAVPLYECGRVLLPFPKKTNVCGITHKSEHATYVLRMSETNLIQINADLLKGLVLRDPLIRVIANPLTSHWWWRIVDLLNRNG